MTLVELLIALSITAIILTAATTLAYAMTNAGSAIYLNSQEQSEVRTAVLRINELISNSRLVAAYNNGYIYLWACDTDRDNLIDATEIIRIEPDVGGSGQIAISQYHSPTMIMHLTLSQLRAGMFDSLMANRLTGDRYVLVEGCSNVTVSFDAVSPQTKFVSIRFNVIENANAQFYEIGAALRGWAGHLLTNSTSGAELVGSDDD